MAVGELLESGPITIQVLVTGGQIKVGIDALKEMKVLRGELVAV